jgi:hypothetical protein
MLQIEKLKSRLHHQLLNDKEDKAQNKLKTRRIRVKARRLTSLIVIKTKVNKTKRIYRNKKTKKSKPKTRHNSS